MVHMEKSGKKGAEGMLLDGCGDVCEGIERNGRERMTGR